MKIKSKDVLIIGGTAVGLGAAIYILYTQVAKAEPCSEGRVLQSNCPDGSSIITANCVGGTWVPTGETCPEPPPNEPTLTVTIPPDVAIDVGFDYATGVVEDANGVGVPGVTVNYRFSTNGGATWGAYSTNPAITDTSGGFAIYLTATGRGIVEGMVISIEISTEVNGVPLVATGSYNIVAVSTWGTA